MNDEIETQRRTLWTEVYTATVRGNANDEMVKRVPVWAADEALRQFDERFSQRPTKTAENAAA